LWVCIKSRGRKTTLIDKKGQGCIKLGLLTKKETRRRKGFQSTALQFLPKKNLKGESGGEGDHDSIPEGATGVSGEGGGKSAKGNGDQGGGSKVP